ncbi:MAG: hypothetical protein II978_03775, partial [Clostridia bacterium]|nr:hypothetical protein [Clostridia bacterium]
MKKRLISLFLAVLMVLGTCIFAVAETQEKSDEFEFLSVTGFGLDLSEPEKLLTRADLAKLAINLKGVSIIKDGDAVCYDVPKKHWAFPVVNTVMHYGLMGPGADGLFHPDRTATVMDGSRILMGLLGYDEIGKAANWNDSTYYNKARSLGLFRGVKDTKDGLTIRALAGMAINILSIPVAKVTSIEGDASQYAVDEKNTYIKENYGYEIIEGVVQAVGEQTLSGIAKVNKKSIKINGNTYNAKGKNYLKYLGMDVKAVVDPESGVVLAISADADYEELVVPAKDILSYENFEFKYLDEKEKEKIIDVPKDCEIVLNGQTVTKYNENDFMPISGEVRFVDKDDDGTYEMVYITSDIYLKVNGIYEGERLIDAVTSQIIELDSVNVQCVKDGVA